VNSFTGSGRAPAGQIACASSLGVVVALVLLLTTSVARASLISTGLFAGDGRVTLDTDTSLEWLGVAETTDLKVAEILAGGGNDPTGPGGWITNGWRYATLPEICGLMAGRIGGLPPCGQPMGPQSAAGIAEVQAFLGVTLETGENTQMSGFFDGGFVETLLDDGFGAAVVIPGGGIPGGATSSPFVGHFLVRSAVPEPGPPLALLTFAALLTRLSRR